MVARCSSVNTARTPAASVWRTERERGHAPESAARRFAAPYSGSRPAPMSEQQPHVVGLLDFSRCWFSRRQDRSGGTPIGLLLSYVRSGFESVETAAISLVLARDVRMVERAMAENEAMAHELASRLRAVDLAALATGGGVHWQVDVGPAASRTLRVHCFWYERALSGIVLGMNPANARSRLRAVTKSYEGPEYLVILYRDGIRIADGRTHDSAVVVDCAKEWLSSGIWTVSWSGPRSPIRKCACINPERAPSVTSCGSSGRVRCSGCSRCRKSFVAALRVPRWVRSSPCCLLLPRRASA